MKKLILFIFASLCSIAAFAQVKVTGTVYEPSGETCIGATVIEKGKPGNGTATDLDGNFTINVSSSKATIVVSYIGMQTQEIKLDGQTHLEIHMKDDTATLDEVVVVGYGTQKKINATGAVKTIGNDVLESRPVTNAVQGLQGAVAGLNITNDNGGAPGESMNINIRGVGNIGTGSSSSPLVLIDGMEGDLSRINPADIENISVLKDAAAASIYGSRAPFGVILVTTKSGKKGTTVNYSGNVRFQQPINTPHTPDSYTYALMVNDASNNSGSQGRGDVFKRDLLNKILAFQRGEIKDGTTFNASRPEVWLSGENAWGNTDWYDVFLKKVAVSQEHNVSVSGGSDNVNYYLSGNYLDQAGIFKFSDEKYQRLAISGKVNIKFNKYVQFQWTSRLITTDNNKPSALGSMFFHQISRLSPLTPLYTPLGEYHPDSMIEALEHGGRTDNKTQQVYNQGNLTVTPIKDWNIHVDVGSRIENNKGTIQYKPISYTASTGESVYMLVNKGWGGVYNVSGSGISFSPAEGEAFFSKTQTNINYFTTNVYTDYSLTLKEKHNFKFLVGMQTEYYKNDITRVASNNILIPDTPFFTPSKGDDGVALSEGKGEWSSVGIFGRINYNYEDKYMAEVNLRGDAASRFPKNQRWGVFPSFSVGWNIANEKFWEDLYQTWNYFKLRASYGTLGNQNTNSFYPYYQSMSAAPGSLVLGDAQATLLPMFSPYSTSLTWEKIENIGAGVDVAFFNNRLNASFDWYQRTTKNMIGPAFALPAVFGASAPNTNNAELRTRGWELELSWKDRIGEFNYSVSASLSDYKSVVTKYDSPNNNIYGWYQNKNYGDIWGYEVKGIAKSDKEMNEHLSKANQTALGTDWGGGDVMYADLNGDGKVDPGSNTLDNHGDLKVIGNTTPRFAYSFTLEANWKFIDFRAYFQGIGKRDYFAQFSNQVGAATYFGYDNRGQYQGNLFLEHLDYFRYAGAELGANEDAYYGRLRWDGNNAYVSDRFLQDASYLRLKNLQIGFSIPQKWHISKYVKARLYFSAENVFTITKLKIYDPEALTGYSDSMGYGVEGGKTYPQYRTYAVGLDLTF